jgi:hypothetical protein
MFEAAGNGLCATRGPNSGFAASAADQPGLDRARVVEDLELDLLHLTVHYGLLNRSSEMLIASLGSLLLDEAQNRLEELQSISRRAHLVAPSSALLDELSVPEFQDFSAAAH